jgi:phage gp46-like protein
MTDETHDIAISFDESLNAYDIGFGDTGDFLLEDTFDTNIAISLLSDARADQSEIEQPERRRGYWADELLYPNDPNQNFGSKLWLVQGRKLQTNLNRAIDYANVALQWLITNNHVKALDIQGSFILNGIQLDINYVVDDNVTKKLSFQLWLN